MDCRCGSSFFLSLPAAWRWLCIFFSVPTFHDFYRTGEETGFAFDMLLSMRKGHDFKDYICPDTFEFEKDYFRIGDRYGRVIFLREYISQPKTDLQT